MPALYFLSLQPRQGKTTLAVGLAQRFLARGLRPGYMRPLTIGRPEDAANDQDALFLKRFLGLQETVGELCPVALSAEDARRLDFLDRLEAAYRRAAQGRDFMLLEGPAIPLDEPLAPVLRAIAEALDARTVLLCRYHPDITPDGLVSVANALGPSLMGLVLTMVPSHRLRWADKEWRAPLEQMGLPLLGMLPEDRALFAITVAELAAHLQGEVIIAPERGQELVERVLLGILTSDSIAPYFERFPRKAVVARGDRPDIHLAALRHGANCLIVPGDRPPEPDVLYLASELQVPIVRVPLDTLTVCERLASAFGQGRFHHTAKLGPLAQLLDAHFDWGRLAEGLGTPI